jgi:LAO/AO transport system kinase
MSFVGDPLALAAALRAGDRVALGRALTLIESTRADHRLAAEALLAACLPYSGRAKRIAITGTPGVGKSTFIDAFGMYLIREQGLRVAVLAIDPSSRLSRGSILGDKTRMAELSVNEMAFIRPSPAGESLGGVALRTRECLHVCEAAGFDIILVETVGVGQSEVAAQEMTDFFLLLLQPGAGDELQGIKRGIVELADGVAVNKADGDKANLAKQAAAAYSASIHLLQGREDNWSAKVQTCSALTGAGLPEIWSQVQRFAEQMEANGWWTKRRELQTAYWLDRLLREAVWQQFLSSPAMQEKATDIRQQVLSGQISVSEGVRLLTNS